VDQRPIFCFKEVAEKFPLILMRDAFKDMLSTGLVMVIVGGLVSKTRVVSSHGSAIRYCIAALGMGIIGDENEDENK
jgi:hypothetical protein